jgi:hypothetical protein
MVMVQGAATKAVDRVTGKGAAEVSARARLSEEARGLLAEGMTARQYLDTLIERRLDEDAVQFLAHALPKREAIWWGSLCVGQELGSEPPAAAAGALEAARAWVIEPKDENRRATFPAAEAAAIGTPAGCTAAAAYFSGGSLAPAHLAAVAPPEHVTALLVASALTLAAVVKEPEKAVEKYASFLLTGLEVACGQVPWPEASPGSAAGEPTPVEPMSERDRKIAEMRARRARR